MTSTHAPAVVGNGIQIVHGWIRWINRTHNIIRQIQTLDRKVDKVADLFPTNTIPASQPTLASTEVQNNNTTKTEFDNTIPVNKILTRHKLKALQVQNQNLRCSPQIHFLHRSQVLPAPAAVESLLGVQLLSLDKLIKAFLHCHH